jgi:hypothetical protein
MKMRISTSAAVVAWVLGTGAASALPPQTFDFTFNPGSGLSGSLNIDVSNSGTLIGDWNAKSNPTGTRTKPGLFGSFGSTENIPVPVTLGAHVGGTLATHTAGAFRLTLDPASGSVAIAEYATDFLSSGPATLPATVSMSFSTFRTRTPDSTYIGGIPLSIPIGDVQLTAMSAVQTGPAGIGTLTPTGANTYDFTVAAAVELSASFSVLGSAFELPPTPVVLPLAGQITVTGSTAQLTSLVPLKFQNTTDPGAALPQFPLDLPTILPPGGTAHLLMDLILDEISANLAATLATNATGTLIPAPPAAALLPVAWLVAARRRRA